MSSLANRYLRALLSHPLGPRPRAGCSFWQRYWTSLTGMAFSPRMQADVARASESRTVHHRFATPIPAALRGRSNRWMAAGLAMAAVAVMATILSVGVFDGKTSPSNSSAARSASISSPINLGINGPNPPFMGTIHLPRGHSMIDIHKQPYLSSHTVMQARGGTTIDIFCTAQGDVVKNSDTGHSSRLWDYMNNGYVPTVYVDAGTDHAAIGSC